MMGDFFIFLLISWGIWLPYYVGYIVYQNVFRRIKDGDGKTLVCLISLAFVFLYLTVYFGEVHTHGQQDWNAYIHESLLYTPSFKQQNVNNARQELWKPIFNRKTPRNSFTANTNVTSKCENDKVCDIYYIKVHKTGSTTLQNILYRFGLKNNLKFAMFRCGNGMPYPNPAKLRYLVDQPKKFDLNIMSEHAQYDPVAYKSYMNASKTVFISLLRHPLNFLKSTLSFHGLLGKMGLLGADFVSDFLDDPVNHDVHAKYTGSSAECGPWKTPSFTKNAMAYHFGLTNQSENRVNVIWKWIQEMDNNLTMVLISEKFDESLVLMRRKFNWSMKDITYLPLWSLRFLDRKDLNMKRTESEMKTLEAKHKEWSKADYMLYTYFSSKLNTILSQQGDEFWDEVNLFKKWLLRIKSFCMGMCYIDLQKLLSKRADAAARYLSRHEITLNGKSKGGKESVIITYLDCVSMMEATLNYQSAIKVNQNKELCRSFSQSRMRVQSKFCNEDDFLVFTMPWSVVRYDIFASRSVCLRYFEVG